MDKLPKELRKNIMDFTGASKPKQKYSENQQNQTLVAIDKARQFVKNLKDSSGMILNQPLTKNLTQNQALKIGNVIQKERESKTKLSHEDNRKDVISKLKRAGFSGKFKTLEQDPQNRQLKEFLSQMAKTRYNNTSNDNIMTKDKLKFVGGVANRDRMSDGEKKAMVNTLINKPKGSLKNTNQLKKAVSKPKAKAVSKPKVPRPTLKVPRPTLKAVPKPPPKPKPSSKPKPSKTSMKKSVGGATIGKAKKPLKKGYKANPTCWTSKATNGNGKRKKICV